MYWLHKVYKLTHPAPLQERWLLVSSEWWLDASGIPQHNPTESQDFVSHASNKLQRPIEKPKRFSLGLEKSQEINELL